MKAGLVVLALALGGCGNSGGGGNLDGGGHMLDDGHVQSGCMSDADCDTSKKCVVPHCNAITHACEYPAKMCSSSDACNASVCDMSSGDCATTPANDGMSCSTAQGAPGTCVTGICLKAPSCWDSNFSFATLACDNTFGGLDYNNNFPSPFGPPPTQQTSKYGSCATNETAPEYAYVFNNGSTSDTVVTIHLYVQGTLGGPDGGVPDMSGPFDDGGAPAGDGGTLFGDGGTPDDAGPGGSTVDMAAPGGGNGDVNLDLIILEGACLESSPCANPQLTGGGYQGITLGTGNETVTFTAKASTQYYVVVDGKNGASASYVIMVEACGICQPTPQNTVGCGQSVPVSGNTASGSGQIGSYACNNGGTFPTFSALGNEQFYYFPPVNQDTEVRATVTGASQALTLAVMQDNSTAQCDPSACVVGATATGATSNMSASVTFTAANSFGYNTPYWIVVDSPMGMDSTYGLSLDCLGTCTQSSTLDCTNKSAVSSTSGQPAAVSAWGPAGNTCGDVGTRSLAGPEYVMLFHKPATTGTPIYRFTLAAQTNNTTLGLLVLDAGASAPTSCAPDSTCAMTTPMHVTATSTTLESTGSYLAEAPGVNASFPNGRTAVVDLASGTIQEHYYLVVVDGVTASDAGGFALSIDSGCM